SGDAPPRELTSGSLRIPSFEFPEDAARALAHAARWAHWRRRPKGRVVQPSGCRPVEAAAIVSRNLAAGEGWLATGDLLALLDCYGLPLIATRAVHSPDDAAAAAGELDGPVALKPTPPGLTPKTTPGGGPPGLPDPRAVP